MQVGGEELRPPRPLPWYPRKLAWQMDASRAQLRKLDALAAVHDFMKRENDSGGITRQEAVSMVPPLFLDVLPHHRVCLVANHSVANRRRVLQEGKQHARRRCPWCRRASWTCSRAIACVLLQSS